MLGDPGLAQIPGDSQERHAGLLAQLPRGDREPLFLDVAHDELRPFFGETLGDDAAEPLRRTRDDRHPALVAAALCRLRERQRLERSWRLLLGHRHYLPRDL